MHLASSSIVVFMLPPLALRVVSRIRCLNRSSDFGAIVRLMSGPAVKLNPRNFRSCGRATALFAAVTRITAQLIDAVSGAHLWADHFDGPIEDVFELQDSVALSVAGVIEPTLQAAEMLLSAQRPTDDLTAYDLYLRARAAAQAWDRQGVLRALDLLRQALERDPYYGSALALVAPCPPNPHVN